MSDATLMREASAPRPSTHSGGVGDFVACVIVYIVASLTVAYPWHMTLFHEQYVEMGAFTRSEPIMPFGILAMVIQGSVFAYLFPIYVAYRDGTQPRWMRRGVEFALLFGSIVWSVMVFATAAKFDIEPVARFVLYATSFQILQYLLVGAGMGGVYALREKAVRR